MYYKTCQWRDWNDEQTKIEKSSELQVRRTKLNVTFRSFQSSVISKYLF